MFFNEVASLDVITHQSRKQAIGGSNVIKPHLEQSAGATGSWWFPRAVLHPFSPNPLNRVILIPFSPILRTVDSKVRRSNRG